MENKPTTQVELDAMLRELNVRMNDEYHEVDMKREDNAKALADMQAQINRMKEVVASIKADNLALDNQKRDITRRYHAEREELIKQNLMAYGQRTPRNEVMTRHEMYALRDRIRKLIGGQYDDLQNDVHFKEYADCVTYTIVIPKTPSAHGKAE